MSVRSERSAFQNFFAISASFGIGGSVASKERHARPLQGAVASAGRPDRL
jgi:hypothetical protein